MNFKIWIANLVLAVVLVFSGIHLWDVLHDEPRKLPSQDSTGKNTGKVRAGRYSGQSLGGSGEYELVAAQNLFSPDRKEFIPEPEPELKTEPEPEPEPESEAEPEKKPVIISGQKVVLYGVVLSDESKIAMINNPGGQLGDRPYLWIKEGQLLGDNLLVQEIFPSQVILEGDKGKFEILLSEKKTDATKRQPSKRAQNRDTGPTIVSGSPPSGSLSESGSREQSKPLGNSSADKQNSEKEAEYEVIETPFGPIKRKIK